MVATGDTSMNDTIRSKRMAMVSAGFAIDNARSEGGHVAKVIPSALTAELREAVDTLLLMERLMITLYYTGLTSPSVMRDNRLSGPSGDPINPGLPPGGNPAQVRYLQAALDAEVKHAAILFEMGATSSMRSFYFPPSIFTLLGSTMNRASFLGTLDMLETVCVGAYIAAATQFIHGGRPDLAATAAAIMGVESEHRTLGRVIANITPANSRTLETAPYAVVAEVVDAIQPFVDGTRFLFASGAPRPVAVPTAAQTARVIGRHGTRLVHTFKV